MRRNILRARALNDQIKTYVVDYDHDASSIGGRPAGAANTPGVRDNRRSTLDRLLAVDYDLAHGSLFPIVLAMPPKSVVDNLGYKDSRAIRRRFARAIRGVAGLKGLTLDTTVEFTHSKLTANIEHWSGWLYIPDADVRIDFRGKSCYKADVVKRLWINALVSSYGKFSSRGNKIAWTGEAVRLGPDGSRYAAMNSWARYCTKYGEKHGSKVKSQFQNMRAPDSQIRRGRSMWTLGGIERSKTETIAGDISANDVQFLRDSGTVVKESDLGDMRLIKLGTRPASQVADIVNDMMEARAERDVSN